MCFIFIIQQCVSQSEYCGRKNNSKPALISHAALDVGISVQRRPSPVPITQKPVSVAIRMHPSFMATH